MLLDAKHLALLAKADQGDVKACQEITRILSATRSAGNEKLLKRYYDLILKNHRDEDTTDIVEVMRRRGICDLCGENFFAALGWYLKAIHYMVEKYSPEEWDLEVFDDLKFTAEIIRQEANKVKN